MAAIVVLRTVLNYFLQKEIDRATARAPEAQARMATLSPMPGKGDVAA